MDGDIFLKGIIKRLQTAQFSGHGVSHSDDYSNIELTFGDTQLVIYQKDKLIGYEIIPLGLPGHGFMSDNDLYENKDIIESTREEILYVLNEYIEKRISIYTKLKRTWYGKDRIKYYINLTLPSGENIECKLPCVNQIDFGL
ncbi:hypothetical protein D3C85_998060 [compost metagenome]